MEAIKIIMRYLKATRSVDISYGRKERRGKNFTIKEYSNSDWAGDHATKKLTFDFVFMLNGDLVS